MVRPPGNGFQDRPPNRSDLSDTLASGELGTYSALSGFSGGHAGDLVARRASHVRRAGLPGDQVEALVFPAVLGVVEVQGRERQPVCRAACCDPGVVRWRSGVACHLMHVAEPAYPASRRVSGARGRTAATPAAKAVSAPDPADQAAVGEDSAMPRIREALLLVAAECRECQRSRQNRALNRVIRLRRRAVFTSDGMLLDHFNPELKASYIRACAVGG
jgi:hypothetical protein